LHPVENDPNHAQAKAGTQKEGEPGKLFNQPHLTHSVAFKEFRKKIKYPMALSKKKLPKIYPKKINPLTSLA
jgi:hypothetical protein